MTPKLYGSADLAITDLGRHLRRNGREVKAPHWQSVEALAPMLELYGPSFRTPIDTHIDVWSKLTGANQPWAEEHFQERVSGIPYNPPPSTAIWPFNPGSFEFKKNETYSHTYPERMWPKHEEGPFHTRSTRKGIRYNYGDLRDVVDLLNRDPLTRQAFLPIWFPEDTGAVHGERVPCTLGYLFMFRDGFLHCTYYIRSCDYYRHLRDDVYLAGRLVHWVLNQLGWNANPGFLDMHIGSLHCWITEQNILPK